MQTSGLNHEHFNLLLPAHAWLSMLYVVEQSQFQEAYILQCLILATLSLHFHSALQKKEGEIERENVCICVLFVCVCVHMCVCV